MRFPTSITGLSPSSFPTDVPRRFLYCSSSLFVSLWFQYYFVLVFFSPFSIAITSLGEERVDLSAFRTFVRFELVWFFRFPLPLGVWEGLRFVILALPGLFSYIVFICDICVWSFLFLISPSFCARGGLCFVIVALPGYLHLYSLLSLSRIPRDSLNYFEISVPRHIRVERMRKTIN